MEYQHITHPFPPVFNEKSCVLILGSLPSVKSREIEFYYGHPQNRFWSVLSEVLNCTIPDSISEKKEMLLTHRIALWDVIAQCDIIGSDDSSIKNALPNNILYVMQKAPIRRIFTNGKVAYRLYQKFLEKQTGISAVPLPSTSPANAAFSKERLAEHWHIVADSVKI